jgi:hypothetical protein
LKGNHVTAYSSYQAYPGQAPTLLEPPPVLVAVLPPQPQSRVSVLFRLLLAIPHYIVLYFIGIAAVVVAFLGWWGALFTGQLPQFAVTFLSGYLRWSTRLSGYTALLTDTYPPFSFDDDPEYPVRIAIPAPQRLNRAAVFFRLILAVPANFVFGVLIYGAFTLMAFFAWLITLFTGQLPVSFHLAYAAVIRYQTRFFGYFLMLTPTYPGKLYGDRPDATTWADGLEEVPAPGYGTPGPGYGNPAPGYGTPAPGWGNPAPGYGNQAPGYGNPAPGWGNPAPGYGPSGPGYGAPVDGPPAGYSTPGYGGPGYGAPAGYGTPPGYGTPGAYGAPVGYQPGPVSQSGMWLLSLTSAAKRLVTVFLVLGVLLNIGLYVRNVITTSSTVSSLSGLVRLNDSYSQLSGKVSAWSTATSACGQNLTCATGQAATVAGAFSTFSGQLSGISVSSGATAAKAKLSADTTLLQQDFTKLSQATTPDEYDSTLSSTGLNQALANWSADFTTLDSADS